MRNNHTNQRKKHRRNGTGLTIEEISIMGVEARGRVPWKKREFHEEYFNFSEIEYAYSMSLSGKYLFQDGGMKGKPDYQMIANELNAAYHDGNPVRDRYKVRAALYKYRKKLEGNI